MTEEDTFRKLKQIPWPEMLEILKDRGFVFKTSRMEPDLNEFGWTLEEFNKEQEIYVRRNQ